MTTFTELLTRLHQERFVGRERELRQLEEWLYTGAAAPIMEISGAGGIGKSWLITAFGRTAAERGWHVRRLDGPSAARVAGTADRLLAGPTDGPTLYVVDAAESLGPAVSRLQDELAALEESTRVVLCGRQRLRGGIWRDWEPLMRHIELGAFSRDEQRCYLDLRGVDDLRQREEVLVRTGGHPLTLSLAVDLLVNSPQGEFSHTPTWRSAVRMTVDELVSEVGALFSDAIQAAAVLQRFDRAALAAVLGPENADAGFVRLCSLSMTRLVDDQLALHDEVRRAVIEDLRLHEPSRLDAIRRRALRYYRQVAAAAGGETGLRLSVARLHMVGRDIFGLGALYDEDPEFIVTAAGPDDVPDMLALLRASPPKLSGLPNLELEPDLLTPVLCDADTSALLARDRTGALRGYGFHVRVTERSRRLLGADDELAAVLDDVVARIGAPGGRLPDESNVYFLSTVVLDDEDSVAGGVLGNSVMGLLLTEGVYLAVPARPSYVQITDALQLDHVTLPDDKSGSLHARMIDMSRCGFEGWLRSVMAGHSVEMLPLGAELARIVAESVDAFDDDVALARSPLSLLAEPDDDVAPSERAQAVRELLGRALRATGPWPSPDTRVRDALAAAGITELPSRPQTAQIGLETTTAAAGVTASGVTGAGVTGAGTSPAPAAPGTRITVLGGFNVVRDGRQSTIPHGVVAAAIKIVAVHGSVAADELIELLWPEVVPGLGRDRLRTVMARVRRAGGPDLLVRRGDEVIIGENVSVDAAEFTDAAAKVLHARSVSHRERARAARAAVARYAGELLPADRYSDWTAAPRERLLRQYLDLLDLQAETAESAQDIDGAVRWLERAIDADPYEEERYLRAARMLASDSRRGRALAILQRAQAAAASLGVPASDRVERLQRLLSVPE